jgi:hypothetical protein
VANIGKGPTSRLTAQDSFLGTVQRTPDVVDARRETAEHLLFNRTGPIAARTATRHSETLVPKDYAAIQLAGIQTSDPRSRVVKLQN